MAPLSRIVHLGGMGVFAVAYGVLRAGLLFGAIALFFDLEMPRANYVSALVVLAVASISFIGIG
ncbi:MAG TPA: ABC transporter permease, partial [Actinomycetota bacterium]|nr:ABC transporter permease [Actinomycetota bacterium]